MKNDWLKGFFIVIIKRQSKENNNTCTSFGQAVHTSQSFYYISCDHTLVYVQDIWMLIESSASIEKVIMFQDSKAE